MTDVPAVPHKGKVRGGGDALDPGPALPPGAGPGSKLDDGIVVIDRRWLALLRAAVEERAPISPEDVALAVLLLERCAHRQDVVAAALEGFAEGLLERMRPPPRHLASVEPS